LKPATRQNRRLRHPHLGGRPGPPKGAQRSSPRRASFRDGGDHRQDPPTAVATTMMYRGARLFHFLGFFHFVMSLPTASTIVLRRRFDPEEDAGAGPCETTRAQVAGGRASDAAAHPAAGPRGDAFASYDLSSLRITSLSGSAAAGRAGGSSGWTASANTNSTTSTARPRVGLPRTVATPEGPAGRRPARRGRPAAGGTVVRALRRGGGDPCPQGGGRPDLRRQRDVPSRATRAGGRQRGDRPGCSAAADGRPTSTPAATSFVDGRRRTR